MSLRIIDRDTVRRALPMAACIDQMGLAMQAVSRGESRDGRRAYRRDGRGVYHGSRSTGPGIEHHEHPLYHGAVRCRVARAYGQHLDAVRGWLPSAARHEAEEMRGYIERMHANS